MKHTKSKVALAALALAVTAACGNAGEDSGPKTDVKAKDNAAESFKDGTYMKELADKGKITIGVKYDQPGLGFKDAASDVPKGFDVEIAKLLAADLGIDPDSKNITWEETISDNREPYLQQGRVDLVLASYSITDERRKIVGQTGPYFLTGQQVLVKNDSDVKSIADLKGKKVCAAQGSTSLTNIEAKGAIPTPADNYSQCTDDVLNGNIDAVSTDGSILLGLAKQHEGELKVVGEPFSTERIGVGYSQKHPEMCEWINSVLTKSFENGDWEKAFKATLGGEDIETPEKPKLDACPAA